MADKITADEQHEERLMAALQALFREATGDAEVLRWSVEASAEPGELWCTAFTIRVDVAGGHFTPPFVWNM